MPQKFCKTLGQFLLNFNNFIVIKYKNKFQHFQNKFKQRIHCKIRLIKLKCSYKLLSIDATLKNIGSLWCYGT